MPRSLQEPTGTSNRRRHDLPLPVRTWVRIMRVFHRIDRRSAEGMRDWNLSVARFDILNHAGVHEGATQQELADALLVTKGNICQLLDSLERDGLIRREKHGRSNRIFLTDTGRELRENVMHNHVELVSTAMNALSDEELVTLTNLLRKIERGLDAQEA